MPIEVSNAASEAVSGTLAQAIKQFRAAIRIRPDDAQALCGLGNALVNAKLPQEAVDALRQAIGLAPGEAALHSNLGLAFSDLGLFEEAEACFHVALQISPLFAPAHNNLAILHILNGDPRAALESAEAALLLKPDYGAARRNRALALLALGDFERGWEDYDGSVYGAARLPLPYPAWNGEPLEARRILLTARQGFGDTIQFIRFAPMLKALGAHVILECPLPLMAVLRGAPGVDELAVMNGPLPLAEFSVPLMVLPRIFGTTLATIPAKVPYLSVPEERVAASRRRLKELAGAHHLLVGMAWQGNPHHPWDHFRSMPLMGFEPLAKVPGVRLVSLQRGPGVEQIEAFQKRTGGAMIVASDGRQDSPEDLADTAAMMMGLDLIITVDTALGHLAGALARPVWLALSRASDWRWMSERADTPWYPTMRLFRQKKINGWEELMGRICASVGELVGAASGS